MHLGLSAQVPIQELPNSSADTTLTLRIGWVKKKLKIKELKIFQQESVEALHLGKDVIIVQPTGAGKSLCYVVPALLNPGRLTLVIEPVVAIISDQLNTLTCKGIDAVALGPAAGKKGKENFYRVFKSSENVPLLAFCTPEYLFGTPGNGNYLPTIGQFDLLKNLNVLNIIVIDEVHKIFDRMPSFRPAFDELKRLKELNCPILAMSATVTSRQVDILKAEFLRGDNCITVINSVHRSNLKLQLSRYKRKKIQALQLHDDASDEDSEDDCTEVNSEGETADYVAANTTSSSWAGTVLQLLPMLEGHCTVLYVDFIRDVEQVVQQFCSKGVKAAKYHGDMKIEDRNEIERRFYREEFPVLVATESFELGVDNPNITQVIRVGSPRNLGVLLQEFGRGGRKPGASANATLLFNECIDDKRLAVWLKSSLDSRTNSDANEAKKVEVLATYTKTWQYAYCIYHGKCLLWSLSHFYGGADDGEPPTCFTANAPLCSVCEATDIICEQSVNIQNHLCVLLSAISHLHDNGLSTVTRMLLVGFLMKATSKYVQNNKVIREMIDTSDTYWGCGLVVNDKPMTAYAWAKV